MALLQQVFHRETLLIFSAVIIHFSLPGSFTIRTSVFLYICLPPLKVKQANNEITREIF